MGLGAQVVVLGGLHLARALVVAIAMARHPVENNCRANKARSKRPAVGRRLKEAEREGNEKVQDGSRRHR